MTSMIQDLRYGFRSLVKSPGFAAVAVLTLALGVGANTAIFSVLRAVVLRDLPYHDADRIAVMWTKNIRQNLPDGSSYLNFRDWKERSRTFEQMAAYVRPEFTRGTLSGGPGAERIHIGQVGPGFFELLGTAPLLGRTFEAADFAATPRTVVISHRLWQQRFGADRSVIGRTIQFNDMTVEIVGVMPPEFELPTADVQLWQPLFFGPGWQNAGARGADALVVLGRLRPTATIASARAEMDAIAAQLREQYPATNATFGVITDPLTDRVIGRTTERSLWLLFGSVGFVLLIACANVANLVLARAAARRNEFSLRTALGAEQAPARAPDADRERRPVAAGGRRRPAVRLGRHGRAQAPGAGALPRAETMPLDATVLLFLLAATLGQRTRSPACCRRCSCRPRIRPTCCEKTARARSADAARRRLHQGLVVAEIALAVILLSGAGLLMRSFLRVQATNRGFDSSNVLLLQVDLPGTYDNAAKISRVLHRRDAPDSRAARASSPSARSATSSSIVSRTTASRSTASRRSGPRIRRRR